MRSAMIALLLMLGAAQVFATDLVFVPAPKGESQKAVFQPIAELIGEKLGKTVVVAEAENFLIYENMLQKKNPDLVWSGSHFISWLIEYKGYSALARLPQPQTWVIIGSGPTINAVNDLVGRVICAHAPPNFGTLALLSKFPNPTRQPFILQTVGWKKIYECVASGKGVGGILPLAQLKKFDGDTHRVKLLETLPPNVNQAFAVSPRISSADQEKIRGALLSAEGQNALTALRTEYSNGKPLVAATNDEFKNVDAILATERGFEPTIK